MEEVYRLTDHTNSLSIDDTPQLCCSPENRLRKEHALTGNKLPANITPPWPSLEVRSLVWLRMRSRQNCYEATDEINTGRSATSTHRALSKLPRDMQSINDSPCQREIQCWFPSRRTAIWDQAACQRRWFSDCSATRWLIRIKQIVGGGQYLFVMFLTSQIENSRSPCLLKPVVISWSRLPSHEARKPFEFWCVVHSYTDHRKTLISAQINVKELNCGCEIWEKNLSSPRIRECYRIKQ